MPTVPSYSNFQTTPNAPAPSLVQAPSGPTPGGIAAEQASQMGRALTSTGGEIGKLVQDAAEQVNSTRVMDAVNQAKERMFDLTYNKDSGFTMQKGINALERPDGKDLAVEYSEKFQQHTDNISASLGNDAQRQAFARQSGQMRTEMYGSAERHIAQEFTHYQSSVYDGAVANSQRQIALNYADIGAVSQSVTDIDAAVRAKARLTGLSQEFADVQTRKAVSNAHTLAISTALEKNDVSFADGYLKKFAKQMDADDILRVQGHITKEMDLREGSAVAARAVQGIVPHILNTDGDRAFNILLGTESGNKQFNKDGSVVTSPKGAIGIAQVMPKTGPEAAKLAGLPWDEVRYKNDPTYNRALGRAYFNEKMREFDGDLPKAYAAYNAGAGRVRDSMKRAGASPNGDWLAFMPAETQAYVTKNMAEYSGGGGRAPTPTLRDVHEAVRKDLGPDARPQRVQSAITQSTQQFEELVKAKASQDADNVAGAMRALVQNGGKYSELPASVRTALPPKEVDNVMNFGARVAKGDDTTNSALYLKFATDPGALTKLSDSEFFKLRGQFNEADFKHFAQERSVKLAGGGANGPGELNTQAITATLNDRLRVLKIDPTPKDASAEAANLGVVHRMVRNEIGEAQRLAGKKFNDVETAKFIDGLFATNVPVKKALLGFSYGDTTKSLLALTPGDIPGKVKDSLKADFANRGNQDPTDADYLGAFMQLTKRPKAGATKAN